MNYKKIIPCLDTRNGKVVKGQKFKDIQDVGDPVELAKYYNSTGADELVFYDITASIEGRGVFKDLLKQVAGVIDIPLAVGGGVATAKNFEEMLECGVQKVSINSGAIKDTELIKTVSKQFGKEKVVFAMDVKKVGNDYHVFSSGGTKDTGIDAIEWIKKAEQDGAGEAVVNSIDTDGEKKGYDIELLKIVSNVVEIPIVASGGVGSMQDFADLFEQIPKIDNALGASVFHFKEIRIDELKQFLKNKGLPVRI